MQELTLIKLGGSVITNKEVPMTTRPDVLKRLVGEIVAAHQKTGERCIVGHGQGSFGHTPALRYKTMNGFVTDESPMGMAITQDSAAQLNRIVVQEFLAHAVPAVSFYFSNTMVTAAQKPKQWCAHVLEEYLAKGLFPVTGGDVLVDAQQGCTIWSTEKVLGYLTEYFSESANYRVKRVIHVTEVPGVLDAQGNVIETITPKTLPQALAAIGDTKGFDVTGGMGHKLEESIGLAKRGIEVGIVSGLESDVLFKTLTSSTIVGTRITRE